MSSCIVNERSRNTCMCATNLEIYFTYSVNLNPIYHLKKKLLSNDELLSSTDYYRNYLPNEQQTRTTDIYSTSETTLTYSGLTFPLGSSTILLCHLDTRSHLETPRHPASVCESLSVCLETSSSLLSGSPQSDGGQRQLVVF